MKRFSQISCLLAVLFFVTGVQPLLATTTNYLIEIQNGSGNGFGFSSIHDASGSNPMTGTIRYGSLTGSLIADKDDTTHALSNMYGTLTAGTGGKVQISKGYLNDMGGGFDYLLTGGLLDGQMGAFYFDGGTVCCDGPGAINGGPNNFNANGFSLWGKNWVTGSVPMNGGARIGIDLVGGNYVVNPEPSTILLMGTGLLALPFLRRKKTV